MTHLRAPAADPPHFRGRRREAATIVCVKQNSQALLVHRAPGFPPGCRV
jgi:hypothetical protein